MVNATADDVDDEEDDVPAESFDTDEEEVGCVWMCGRRRCVNVCAHHGCTHHTGYGGGGKGSPLSP